MDDSAIRVTNVHKTFRLPHERQSSVKGMFINLLHSSRTYEKQHVLKGIDFEIKKGEFFGIVGRNGSGKSTLLKLLAGIYTPDKGHIQVNGKLTPFIELGVGFNPELTGRENVYLNGALLGFNRKEMEAMYDEIVGFAELEKFMDQKLKNYSSGMQVRLAFSIAIRAKSDVLLIDEVLAVGDYAFQQKCYEYFKYLQSEKKTVVFVSHDTNALQAYCDKGILIDDGEILATGAIKDVLSEYNKLNAMRIVDAGADEYKVSEHIEDHGYLELNKVITTDTKGNPKNVFAPNEELLICYSITPKRQLDNPTIGLVLQDASGRAIFATNTLDSKELTGRLEANKKVELTFKLNNVFNDGRYYISGAIASSDRKDLFYRFQNAHNFNSTGWITTAKGIVYLPYGFSVRKI